jgi:hypothetical protein
VIERVPGGDERARNARFTEDEIFIPLRREVPVVQKDTVIKETVRVGKNIQEQQTNVTTRLREEQLKIQQQGEAQGTGAPGSVSKGTGTEASSKETTPEPKPADEKETKPNQDEEQL